MRFTVTKISLLVFGSGFCALVYQMAWLRLLRLIFGSSTPATAAVLAIFMGGLGLGSLVLGPRADRQQNPLGFYARLELGIAVTASLSPFLILLARWVYVIAGGSQQLGTVGGTLVRVLLATLILGIPTFLMGGTLPAVTRAVERAEDRGRRLLGVLYGANTLGAVLGALTTTFFSIEILGIRRSIWVASLINLLVVVLAQRLARDLAGRSRSSIESSSTPSPLPDSTSSVSRSDIPVPAAWVLISAAIVGFAFFLMELVWYRMLAPLLGGSSYTFGLILAVALLGIGVGGLLYGTGTRSRRPTLLSFSLTCALEALFIILPFALGDSLAVIALVLRDLVGLGFIGLVLSWTVVVSIVVLPAAIIAGYQFPLLVAVLGSGRQGVGKEVGWTYAWNTAGAILGSLAGGFGLIPLLTATGAWRLVALSLVVLAMATACLGARRRGFAMLGPPLALSLLALFLCWTPGPTAFWRHSPIGAGRLDIPLTDRNQLTDEIHRKNRAILWQADGRESSLAMLSIDGAAFMISGKVDGHARQDASTQVMSGLIGLALHPEPHHALVIGLGTGSTAGWMAEVPSVERVDVVELEPDIARVAEDCAAVNQRALENPKVHLIIGDGREILLTSPDHYDFIFSEPSNPYRAGIASLFTRNFYDAVADRLDEDGIFIQWLQGYEVDGQIVRTALATLGIVFDAVEIWRTNPSDLMLIASKQPIQHDPDRLRRLLDTEPFNTAMNRVWGVEGVEGFYAGFIANDHLTRNVLNQEQRWINTDDRPIIEFGFARNVGRSGLFKIEELIELAQRRGDDHPGISTPSGIDRNRLLELRGARALSAGKSPKMPKGIAEDQRLRTLARQQFAKENLAGVCAFWGQQSKEPDIPIDTVMMSECHAEAGDPGTLELIEILDQQSRNVEADAIRARWHLRRGELELAAQNVIGAFEGYRTDPWPYPATMKRLLFLALEIVGSDPDLGPSVFESLRAPFSVQLHNELRKATLFDLAQLIDFDEYCVEVLEIYGPWIPWKERFLTKRLECLDSKDPRAARVAREDLSRFLAVAPFRLETGLEPDV